MMQQLEQNWPVLAVVVVLALLVAWWLFTCAARPVERSRRPDVLDEGVAPAERNQALIDAAPAASAAYAIPPAAGTLGGLAEVIAAAAQEEAADAGAAEMAPGVPDRPADDLTRIKGLGPKLAAVLAGLGVTSYAQIAEWTEADLARIDGALPPAFAGRPARDKWIEQARFLAAGDQPGYEAQFGKL
jgi:predicted flap endonuclease-1-like 5' DNA nuclease